MALRLVPGDARVNLAADARVPDRHFDALLIDAIPSHLMTSEALELYLRKTAPGGLLVFHISNHYYDLRRVLEAAGRKRSLFSAFKERRDDDELSPFEWASVYFVLSPTCAALEPLVARGWTTEPSDDRNVEAWTNDYVNVLAPLWFKLRASLRG